MSRHSFGQTYLSEGPIPGNLPVARQFSKFKTLCRRIFLAALVECIAATVLHALEQSFHCLKPCNPLPELLDFPLRELMPAFRWTRPGRKPEKELAYFI